MKVTNYQPGARGINLDDGSTVWVEPGQTIDLADVKVRGDLPDFGKPADQSDRDADELTALRAKVAELEAKLTVKPAATTPDYERDGLKDVDIHKPATSKDTLLVIAAYEQADVGEDATKAELIKAIEAKRRI